MNNGPRILRVGEEPPPLPDKVTSARAGRPKGKRSSRGRFLTINAFLDVSMATLGRADLAVWLLLWRDTKPDGLARTSQADMARRAGCNPRTARRALAELERLGLLSVVRRGGLKRRMSIYRVKAIGDDDSAQ
jgi:hypothetical protein